MSDKYTNFKEITQKIKDNTNIEDVLSSYINVKKAGKNYTALCPFHAEDTPSFYIFPETQTYHCFGCNAHGDVINFIKEYENMSFIEALKKAASIAGIKLDLDIKSKPKEIELNELYSKMTNEKLLTLRKDHKVWKFLKDREISESTVREFELGYSSGKEVEKALDESLFEEKMAEDIGLFNNKREFFYNRLIIPIKDGKGQIVGFAGRAIDQATKPKYVNTKENKFFKKSKIMYLFDKSKKYIQENDMVIITEGFFDAIAMHNSGYKNTIAVLGSSLTKDHAFELMKKTNKVITMFDMDSAGEKATLSAIETLFPKNFQIAVANYEAKDPDELIQKTGKKNLAETLKKSYKFHEYIIDIKKKHYDLENEFAMEQYLKEMAKWYKKFQVYKRYEIMDSFVNKLSKDFLKDKDLIEKILREHSKRLKDSKVIIKENTHNPQNVEKQIRYDLGKSFIYLWLKYPEYREKIMEIADEELPENPLREFIVLLREGKKLPEILEASSDDLSEIVSEIWKVDYSFNPERIMFELEKTFNKIKTNREIEKLKSQLKDEDDFKKRAELTREIIKLYSKIKNNGGNNPHG
ncbi:MAG: DNA primase [Thermotogota bacterium]